MEHFYFVAVSEISVLSVFVRVRWRQDMGEIGGIHVLPICWLEKFVHA